MTQADLAAATGFSVSFISNLERDARLPDVTVVAERFVPALALGDEPRLADHLIAMAAAARGLQPPAASPAAHAAGDLVSEGDGLWAATLPAPPAPTLGRRDEIDHICRRVAGRYGRLVTLTGPPGVGKTRLAMAVARQLAPLFADGACFVELAAVHDVALVAPHIAAALELKSSHPDTQATLIAYLRRKAYLLVLDNFEQVLPAAPFVATLLAECPDLQIIVTSRERLHLRSEQRFLVAPLTLDAAMDLFALYATAAAPGFQLTARNLPAIEAICRLLDCLPLAIELCAVHVELLPPEVLLSRLQEGRFGLLQRGPVDLPARHRTLARAVHHSYALLDPGEKALFRLLGVYAGGCDPDAVAACGGDVSRIQTLADKHLIRVRDSDEGSQRVTMLETLREFAREQLAETGEANDLSSRHAACYLALAMTAARHLAGAQQHEWLNCLDRELENLRAALQWLLAAAPEDALRLAVALHEYWYLRGYATEGRQWLAQALALADPTSVLYGQGLSAAAQLAVTQYAFDEARDLLDTGLPLLERLGDTAGVADALHWYGHLYAQQAPKQAFHFWHSALTRWRALDDGVGTCRVLLSLVNLMLLHGMDSGQIPAYLAECLERARELDLVEEMARVLLRQGTLDRAAGEYLAAAAKLDEAAGLLGSLGARREQAWALEELGEALWLAGDMDRARASLEAAQKLFQEMEEKLGLAIVLHHLAQIERRFGQLAAAAAHYAESLRRSEALSNAQMIARCLAGLGSIALERGDAASAAALAAAAERRFAALPPFLDPGDRDEFADLTARIAQLPLTVRNAARAAGDDLTCAAALSLVRNWIGPASERDGLRA